jgi:hypothetical protein
LATNSSSTGIGGVMYPTTPCGPTTPSSVAPDWHGALGHV